jgi:uncharacterized protein GlcG (DUF336 family)
MNSVFTTTLLTAAAAIGAAAASAQTLPTHRIPAALAAEAASEAVKSCANGGYNETVVVVDADGATVAALRGDGAGIHTLDSAHDKAYTSVTFKNDTMALSDRAKSDGPIAQLGKLPHVLFFPGGVVIMLNPRAPAVSFYTLGMILNAGSNVPSSVGGHGIASNWSNTT